MNYTLLPIFSLIFIFSFFFGCATWSQITHATTLIDCSKHTSAKQVRKVYEQQKNNQTNLVGLKKGCLSVIGSTSYLSFLNEELSTTLKNAQIKNSIVFGADHLILRIYPVYTNQGFLPNLESQDSAKKIAKVFRGFPEGTVSIEVHSNSWKVTDFDILLTQKRADEIFQLATNRSSSTKNFSGASGLSSKKPIDKNIESDANNRTEFIFRF